MEVVRFNNRNYRVNKGYYCSGSHKLHRDVWEFYNEKDIPEGMEIHHLDFNPLNIDVDNLILDSCEEHRNYHKFHNKWVGSEAHLKQLAKARETAYLWHATDGAKEIHSAAAVKGWESRTSSEGTCAECGKTYTLFFNARSKFCSSRCRVRAHRKSKLNK